MRMLDLGHQKQDRTHFSILGALCRALRLRCRGDGLGKIRSIRLSESYTRRTMYDETITCIGVVRVLSTYCRIP